MSFGLLHPQSNVHASVVVWLYVLPCESLGVAFTQSPTEKAAESAAVLENREHPQGEKPLSVGASPFPLEFMYILEIFKHSSVDVFLPVIHDEEYHDLKQQKQMERQAIGQAE